MKFCINFRLLHSNFITISNPIKFSHVFLKEVMCQSSLNFHAIEMSLFASPHFLIVMSHVTVLILCLQYIANPLFLDQV